MCEKHRHMLRVIDFVGTEFQTVFVKIAGYDAELGTEFEGEVKFLNGVPFGDLIHDQRSSLSSECRQYVRENLLHKYESGEFS